MPEETAVIESPVESTPVSTESTETQEPSLEQESTQPTKPIDPKLDRRQNPDALRKALKFLRESGGEHSERAQDLERMLGESKSYKTVWPTVREAREAKQAFDAVGGAAKLAEMQQYTTRMQEVDSMLAAGDKRVIPAIFEGGTAGIAKLLPDIIAELGKTNPNEVSAAVRPHVTGFLESQGLPAAIDAMVNAFNSNKPDEAKEVLAKIINWYKGLGANGAAKTDIDPREQEFNQKVESFETKRFNGEVSAAFEPMLAHAEQVIDRELLPYKKEYGLTDEALGLIRSDVWKRIERERNADPLFKSSMASKVNERLRKVDPSTADFLKSQTDQRVKDATRKEIQLRYGFMKKPPTPGDPATKGNVTEAPAGASSQPDYDVMRTKWGRSDSQNAILSGRALNSAGKELVKVGKIWKMK